MTRLNQLPPFTELPNDMREWLQTYLETSARPRSAVEYTFGSAVDTNEPIRHRLDGRPERFAVVNCDKACRIYRDPDAPKTTRDLMWLRSDVADVTVTLEFS